MIELKAKTGIRETLSYPGIDEDLNDRELRIYQGDEIDSLDFDKGKVSIQLSLGIGPFKYSNSMTIEEAETLKERLEWAIRQAKRLK